jgi:hypothetical protein
MKSRNLTFVGAWAAALLLGSPVAMSGMTSSVPVEVIVNADASGSAQGNMATARFTANTVEYVGCGVRYSISGTTTVKGGWCQATNSAGVNGFCSISGSNTELLNAISGTSDYSYLVFAWNAAGMCTRVGFSTQSFYIP